MITLPFTTNRGNLTYPTSLVPDDEQFLTDSVSHVAYVTSDVLPGKGGRLHYLSTEWAARSIDNSFIAEGTLVRPVMRQGNTWLVAVDQQARYSRLLYQEV